MKKVWIFVLSILFISFSFAEADEQQKKKEEVKTACTGFMAEAAKYMVQKSLEMDALWINAGLEEMEGDKDFKIKEVRPGEYVMTLGRTLGGTTVDLRYLGCTLRYSKIYFLLRARYGTNIIIWSAAENPFIIGASTTPPPSGSWKIEKISLKRNGTLKLKIFYIEPEK